MADDRFLQEYVKKLMNRELNLEDPEPMNDAQLMQVALDMGMNENEWLGLKQKALDSKDRGFEHLERNNFEDAISEFRDSTSLYPNSADAFFGLAKALFKKSVEKEDKFLAEEAIVYVKRALKLNSSHKDSLDLQSYIRRHQNEIGNKILTRGKIDQWKKFLIPGAILMVLGLWFLSTYNSVVTMEETVNKQWAQVENVYARRADLIPQLAKVVKAAAQNEKDIITGALEMRAKATSVTIDASNMTPEQMKKYMDAQSEVGMSLNKLIAVAEAYPQIKSSENFLALQNEVAGSDNRISTERKRYNDEVATFNTKIKRFPTNLLGFKEKIYFEVSNKQMETPDLDL